MNVSKLSFRLFFLILGAYSSLNAQIKLTVQYSEQVPNSNCQILAEDSESLGMTNYEGVFILDNVHSNLPITLIDLITKEKKVIIPFSDTTIIFKGDQSFEEVTIKPQDKKKLYEEVLQKNVDRVPKPFSFKGKAYFAEVYTVSSKNSVDTILEILTCDVIILDLFGKARFFAKNIKTFDKGEPSDPESFKSLLNTVSPSKNFLNQIKSNISYELYSVKKFKKVRASLSDEKEYSQLTLKNEKKSREFFYRWSKNDSSLLKTSRFYEFREIDPQKTGFYSPYSYDEYFNKTHNHSDSYTLNEYEVFMGNLSAREWINLNVFKYCHVEKLVDLNLDLNGYKEYASFSMVKESNDISKSTKIINPLIYPLRFPEGIYL